MSAIPRTSLENWAVLAAIVDEGGFLQAARALNRSQSAVSYAVSRLQDQLGLPLLVAEGRKSVLTPEGEALLRRARSLLAEQETLERVADSLRLGWEAELRLVVDAAYPRPRLLQIVRELQTECPQTRIQLSDAVLSGAEEAIVTGAADLVVTTRVPSGFLGDALMDVTFVAVAHPGHPLFALERTLEMHDLVSHLQAVVRDSGSAQTRDEGWLGASRRCTVSSIEASKALVEAGLAYAWLPHHEVASALAKGSLRTLPLEAGAVRKLTLTLVQVSPALAGPATRAAVAAFRGSEA